MSDAGPGRPTERQGAALFAQVREERDGSRGPAQLLTRVVGLVVLGLAVWLISRNIGWQDTVRLEPAQGADGSAIVLEGEIVGDWRSRPVGFVVGTTGGLESVEVGARLEVGADVVRTAAGRAVAAATSEPGARRVGLVDVRPGLSSTLEGVRPRELGIALVLLVLASFTVATRWWRLLAVHSCPTPWRAAVRYTYAGLFFNLVFPGFNGGDVARAVAVVRRHPGRRPEALMSVVVDRVLGLVSMVLIGAAFILSSDERAAELKLPVTVAAGALLAGGAVFCSERARGLLRVDAILGRLPMGERLQRLDRSARLVASRPAELLGALVFSTMNHLLTGAAVTFIAVALGSALGFSEWMATTAISNTIAGLPISPGGLGVGEHLFGSLAAVFGSTYAMGVATSLIFRVGLYTLSLVGGLVMLLPASSER